jgi:general secretion pathway protein I
LRRAPSCDTGGKTAGFTILEVLVAIAVTAVVLGAIGAVVSSTTRGVRSLEQHVALMETARAVAAGLRAREPLAQSALSGQMSGHRWQIGVSPMSEALMLTDAQATWTPQMITIRVQSPSGAVIDLKTVRLQRRRQ